MNKKRRRLLALLLAALTLLCAGINVSAVESLDDSMESSLTIEYINNSLVIDDAQFDLYYVASRTGYAQFELTESFKAYSVELQDLDRNGWHSLALTLKGYVLRDKVKTAASAKTDEKGKAVFTKLKPGVYLVVGGSRTIGSYVYDVDPFMIVLPDLDEKKNEWIREVTAKPKSERRSTTLPVSRKVLKIWDDKQNSSRRPTSITVKLLCDGKLYETVTLNAQNNWKYEWNALESGHDWTIAESAVSGYKTSVSRTGSTVTITNSYIPDIPDKNTPPPTTPKTDDKQKLPQTGMLWWPIPLLLASGLILLVIGCLRRRGK